MKAVAGNRAIEVGFYLLRQVAYGPFVRFLFYTRLF
jgi:hypothetical protein